MEGWRRNIARYIATLAKSADATTFASDRPTYERHLASAARLVALLGSDPEARTVEAWLSGEERGFGWGYLSGEPGEQATQAFQTLATYLRHEWPASKVGTTVVRQ